MKNEKLIIDKKSLFLQTKLAKDKSLKSQGNYSFQLCIMHYEL